MDKWEHKYLKYKLKYQELKKETFQAGGASKKNDKKEKPKKNVEEKPQERKDDDRPSVYIKCVNVVQKKEDLHFEGKVCKTPPLRIRVSEDANLARIVKVALRFVSKRSRMSDVQKVEIVQGKKKQTVAGDKLDQPIDLANLGEIDEMNLTLN